MKHNGKVVFRKWDKLIQPDIMHRVIERGKQKIFEKKQWLRTSNCFNSSKEKILRAAGHERDILYTREQREK